MPDDQTKVPDAASAPIIDLLTELRQGVKAGRITTAEAWVLIEHAAAAGTFPVISHTYADHIEVVISRDRVWINQDGVNVARWFDIKTLSVRDMRTSATGET